MRIHTRKITRTDIEDAVKGLPSVEVTMTEHASRSHGRAFEVRLTGNGRTGGNFGALGDVKAATWDEWGAFLAALYELDSQMVCGTTKNPIYSDSRDFHNVTGYRFDANELPNDTHKQHKWDYVSPQYFECVRCSAVKNYTGF